MREMPINYLTDDVFFDVLNEENEFGYTIDDFDISVQNTATALQENT